MECLSHLGLRLTTAAPLSAACVVTIPQCEESSSCVRPAKCQRCSWAIGDVDTRCCIDPSVRRGMEITLSCSARLTATQAHPTAIGRFDLVPQLMMGALNNVPILPEKAVTVYFFGRCLAFHHPCVMPSITHYEMVGGTRLWAPRFDYISIVIVVGDHIRAWPPPFTFVQSHGHSVLWVCHPVSRSGHTPPHTAERVTENGVEPPSEETRERNKSQHCK